MGKTEPTLTCPKCQAEHDVSAMKPGRRFQCECGRHLTAPARSGLSPLVIGGIALLIAVPVGIFAFIGGDEVPVDDDPKPAEEVAKDDKPAEPVPDLIQLDYEGLVARTRRGKRSAREEARAELLAFCVKHERYHDEARKVYRKMLDEDPDTPEALDFLKLALVEDLPIPAAEQKALVDGDWFEKASGVLHNEVKSEQRFLDIGLRYAYAPPFVVVKERADNERKDRKARLKARELLAGVYPAFRALLADAVELPEDPAVVVPLFWFSSENAWNLYWDSKTPRWGERRSRNPHWCVYRVSERADPFALHGCVAPMVREAALSMVEAALNKKGMTPQWVTHGIAEHLARVAMDEERGGYRYGAADEKSLARLGKSSDRMKLVDIVVRTDEQDEVARQLLEWLKKQGRDDVTINTVQLGMKYVPPDIAWSLVTFLLEDGQRERFLDFVGRVVKGGAPEAAFKKALGEDVAALDDAWAKWLKAQAK